MTKLLYSVAISAVILLALLLMMSPPAMSQTACAEYEAFRRSLAKKYDEYPTGKGVVSGEKMIVTIFVSKSGSFTILAVPVQGWTCIIATGNGWTAIVPEIVGSPL